VSCGYSRGEDCKESSRDKGKGTSSCSKAPPEGGGSVSAAARKKETAASSETRASFSHRQHGKKGEHGNLRASFERAVGVGKGTTPSRGGLGVKVFLRSRNPRERGGRGTTPPDRARGRDRPKDDALLNIQHKNPWGGTEALPGLKIACV